VRRSREEVAMDIAELRSLRSALDRFAGQFDDCIRTQPSRNHLRTYLRGQLGPLERKSIEPMALDAGVPPRTLQEFLSLHRWDEVAVERRLRALVIRDHFDPNGIGVIDEVSFPKKGRKTAGVQRQYCGATGKTDNCVIAVELGYATENFHALLAADLYLPEEAWTEDRSRCRGAGIPEDIVYRPKWRIALELVERAHGEGVPLGWLTADELYGRVREFREGIARLGTRYVLEIPTTLTGWTRQPEVIPVGTITPFGRVLQKPCVAAGAPEARKVTRLWKRGGPPWIQYLIKTTQKGPVVWEVRETKFFPNHDGVPGKEERLLIAREVLTGEVKYFLSDAPADVPTKVLLFVAFSRWHIERLFEDAKGEVGFDHFEVRCYRALMRHLILTALSLYFLCEETDRLRKKKSVLDSLAGAGGGGNPTGSSETLS
jgi:SRSO17 transposase